MKLENSIIEALTNAKAINISTIDLNKVAPTFDLAIIASGSSTAHVRGLQERILKEVKQKPLGIEGKLDYKWLLIDFGTIIVHIFLDELRDNYDLESLYASWLKEAKMKKEGQKKLPKKPIN